MFNPKACMGAFACAAFAEAEYGAAAVDYCGSMYRQSAEVQASHGVGGPEGIAQEVGITEVGAEHRVGLPGIEAQQAIVAERIVIDPLAVSAEATFHNVVGDAETVVPLAIGQRQFGVQHHTYFLKGRIICGEKVHARQTCRQVGVVLADEGNGMSADGIAHGGKN